MYKNLADMTPEQRAACVGMWAQVKGNRGKFESSAESYLAIIYHAHTPDTDVHETMVLAVGHGVMTVDPRNVTPRFDLPRAWTADGEPVPGEWEDGHVFVSYDEPDPWILKDTVSIEGLSEGGMSYYEEPPNGIEVKLDQFGEGEGKARRWVGEWEEA